MARSFNSANPDIIKVGADLFPTGNTLQVTASAWIFPTQSASNATIIGSAADGGFSFYTSGLALVLDQQTQLNIGSSNAGVLTLNTWNHVVFTLSGFHGTVTFYVNGVAQGSASGAAYNFTPASNTWIGCTAGGGGTGTQRPFAGRIADVAVWPATVLTASQISALGNGARPFNIGTPSAYYPLDGLQSPEPDLSGNAKNGTLTGTALADGPPVMMSTPRWPQGAILPTSVPVVPSLLTGFAWQEW